MPDDQLRFDVRLDSIQGKDIHRTFKGTYFRGDRSLAIAEVKLTVSGKILIVVVDRNVYRKGDGTTYSEEDILPGTRLQFSSGDKFIVTRVDGLEGIREVPQEELITNERLLEIQRKMREKIKERGAKTIQGLGRHFRILNDNRDKGIDEREFSKAIREYGFNVTDDEVRALMKLFDSDGNGVIDYQEFLRVIRGDMSEFRKALVHKAFKKLDANKNGVIQLDDIKLFYNAKGHEQVLNGQKTEDEVLSEFLDAFDTVEKDGTVTYEEFEKYYKDVSVSIDDDEYFALMMQRAWNIE